MKKFSAVLLACLCLAACKDKHEPLKPTVAAAVVVVQAPAA
ncbi:MAG: hypothetical protein JWQ01_1367 [Massilia sp.]|nr:hypothetical protein [Massilia sp.]